MRIGIAILLVWSDCDYVVIVVATGSELGNKKEKMKMKGLLREGRIYIYTCKKRPISKLVFSFFLVLPRSNR